MLLIEAWLLLPLLLRLLAASTLATLGFKATETRIVAATAAAVALAVTATVALAVVAAVAFANVCVAFVVG